MGNICRSPTAEGFFKHHLARSGLAGQVQADSAGTHSYHIGNSPDRRAVAEAASYGVDISGLRARKVRPDDYARFDRMIAMDRHNLEILQRMAPDEGLAELALMMDYLPGHELREVPDPYYGSQRDFAFMCDLLDRATRQLARSLETGADAGS